MNTFCLYNNQLQLLFSPDHVILLLGNLPGDKVLHLVHLPVLVQLLYNLTLATSNGFPTALIFFVNNIFTAIKFVSLHGIG